MHKSYGIIPNRKAIIRAAATVRCSSTITANVGISFKKLPTNTGKTRRYSIFSISVLVDIFKLILSSLRLCFLC